MLLRKKSPGGGWTGLVHLSVARKLKLKASCGTKAGGAGRIPLPLCSLCRRGRSSDGLRAGMHKAGRASPAKKPCFPIRVGVMIAGGDDPCLATCVEGKLEEMSERELWGQRWARKLPGFSEQRSGI